ncbi:MAG: PKD domain-containing protein, partial [Thermoplasmata archaeon]
DVQTALTAWDGTVYEGWRGDYVELNFGIVRRENARLIIVADDPVLKTRIYVHVWNGTDWELADTMHHRMNFAEDVIDLSRFVPTQDDLRVRLLAASHFALEQVGLDTSPPKTASVQSAALLNAVHSSGTDVTGLVSHPDASYAELVPGEEILLAFDIPTTVDDDDDGARSFIFVSRGHYVHKYQPLQGTEVHADGLAVLFESIISEAPLGQFWEIEIVRLVWKLGDGTFQTGRMVSHVYAQAGEYTIAIRIEYSDGTAKFYERVILVFG